MKWTICDNYCIGGCFAGAFKNSLTPEDVDYALEKLEKQDPDYVLDSRECAKAWLFYCFPEKKAYEICEYTIKIKNWEKIFAWDMECLEVVYENGDKVEKLNFSSEILNRNDINIWDYLEEIKIYKCIYNDKPNGGKYWRYISGKTEVLTHREVLKLSRRIKLNLINYIFS